MGAFIEVDVTPITRAMLRVRRLRAWLPRPSEIMRGIAKGLVHQTRVRIYFEKTDPEGRKWRPWSIAYAKTRRAQHSLLVDTHDMVDGLQTKSTGNTATVFSRAPYAGAQQAGVVDPPRAFLGLSDANARDLEYWIGPEFERMLQRFLPRNLGGGL